MARRYDTVSFLTDYGSTDEFVGVCKAVMRDLAPHVTVVDLTHGIPPFDVRAGALALARSVSYLPQGIVVAVVDPGVGTDRKAVAIEVSDGDGIFVGPDNGLLAPAVALAGGAQRAVALTDARYQLEAPGGTFAGRDVLMPAAAHLCNGVDLFELGEQIEPAVLMPGIVPLPREDGGRIVGEVLWVDRFGNCQLNVSPGDVDGWGSAISVEIVEPIGGAAVQRSATLVDSFAEARRGALGLVTDGSGLLALVLDRRSAAEELGLTTGTAVTLSRIDGPVGEEPTVTAVQIGRRD